MRIRRKTKKKSAPVTAVRTIEDQILVVRGQRVMIDSDLARLYGVSTKRINEQVKRNRKRFPDGFVFQLTLDEARSVAPLRSQIATLKRGQHIKHAPHVFTEHGAIMLATVLNSAVAVQASVFVVRAFVRMRSIIAEYSDLAAKVDELEQKYDAGFRDVFAAIRQLVAPPKSPKRLIGFVAGKDFHRTAKRK